MYDYMIRELFTNKNHNFYQGEHDGGDVFDFFQSIDFSRKEIFTKKSMWSRPVEIDSSEILEYLLLSDFKHIYYSTTIIQGYDCICLILDENLISENFQYLHNRTKCRKVLGLTIDNYPVLPKTRHRLLCTIRIDKQSDKETKKDIYIYSYGGKKIKPIIQDGEYNFGQSLNFIRYSNFERNDFDFIIFPEVNNFLEVFHFAKIKFRCSRLDDFYAKLISEYAYPTYMNQIRCCGDDNPFEHYKKYEDKNKSDILNTLYFLLLKKECLFNIYFNINITDDGINCHIFINSNLNMDELKGFPILEHDSVNNFFKKRETKKIIVSIRQEPDRLIYFSYFGYVSKLIDDNHNLSNASDSFSLAFHNGMYIRSDMWSGKSYTDRDWFIIFYDDDSKKLYQLPVGEVERIPKYNNVSIEKRGSFYYAFKGHSVKPHRRLVDLLENFYFEYDFRHKEIFRHSVIRYYDDKK